ncbi:MAG: hypothetical protein AAF926_08945 [Pseudomonadota bacterium]
MNGRAKFFFLALCATALPSGHVNAAEPVTLDRPYLTVGDVIDLDHASDAAHSLLALPLFRLEPGQVMQFDKAQLEQRLQRRVPGLKGRLRQQSAAPLSVIYVPPPVSSPLIDEANCIKLNQALEAGTALRATHVTAGANCSKYTEGETYYDAQASTYRATSDLAVGTVLPIRSSSILPDFIAGDILSLRSQVGPVEIVRPVTLLRSSWQDRLASVRTSDGQVIRAVLPDRGSAVREEGGQP